MRGWWIRVREIAENIIIFEFLARCKTTYIMLKTRRNIKIVVRSQITYLSVRDSSYLPDRINALLGTLNENSSKLKRRYVCFDVADDGTNLLILWQCTMCIVLLSRWSITKLARLPRRREKRTVFFARKGDVFSPGYLYSRDEQTPIREWEIRTDLKATRLSPTFRGHNTRCFQQFAFIRKPLLFKSKLSTRKS